MSLSNEKNTEVVSRAVGVLQALLGDGKKTVRGGQLSLRYDALPSNTEGLVVALESVGAKIDYAFPAPVSSRLGGGVRLEVAGVLEGVRFLASGAGELGLTQVDLAFYVNSADAASDSDQALFKMLDRIFGAPGMDNLLSRYLRHSLDTLGPKAAKRLARDMSESLADYLSN